MTVLRQSSSPRRLRGAADRAEVAGGSTCPSFAAALESKILHLLPAVRKGKEGGAESRRQGRGSGRWGILLPVQVLGPASPDLSFTGWTAPAGFDSQTPWVASCLNTLQPPPKMAW